MKSDKSKQPLKKKTVIFCNRFVLRTHITKIHNYNVYQGADIDTKQAITAYVRLIKTGQSKDGFCKPKRELYNKLTHLTPKFIWSGDERINGVAYQAQIFERLGPSLNEVFKICKFKLEGHTPHMIIFNILVLLDKLHEQGFVYRNLNLAKLFLSKNCNQNEIFFAEFIESCRKGETPPIMGKRYSSIGSHLGLVATPKDDYESLCYMIIDMFTQGSYFSLPNNLKGRKSDAYLAIKNDMDPLKLTTVPSEYIDFYLYIRNVSIDQTLNIDHWRKLFKKTFQMVGMKIPYAWVPCKKYGTEPPQTEPDILPDDSDEDAVWKSEREFFGEEDSLVFRMSKTNQLGKLSNIWMPQDQN